MLSDSSLLCVYILLLCVHSLLCVVLIVVCCVDRLWLCVDSLLLCVLTISFVCWQSTAVCWQSVTVCVDDLFWVLTVYGCVLTVLLCVLTISFVCWQSWAASAGSDAVPDCGHTSASAPADATTGGRHCQLHGGGQQVRQVLVNEGLTLTGDNGNRQGTVGDSGVR